MLPQSANTLKTLNNMAIIAATIENRTAFVELELRRLVENIDHVPTYTSSKLMRSIWLISNISIEIANGLLIQLEEVQWALTTITSITHQTVDETAILPNSSKASSSSAWTLPATSTKVALTLTMISTISIIATMPRSTAVAPHPQ